jgi:hypothetical protein
MIPLDCLFIHGLHDSFDTPMEEQFAKFEAQIGAPLPADYRELLSMRNGGVSYLPLTYPIPENAEGITRLSQGWYTQLFHLATTDHARVFPRELDTRRTLQHNYEYYKATIPPDTIAMADLAGEELYLLELGDKRHGSISIWVRDNEDPDDVSKNRVFAAPSVLDWILGSVIDKLMLYTAETLPAFQVIGQFDHDGLRQMLEDGLDANSINQRGESLLFFSGEKYAFECAELLLQYHADPNLKPPRPDGHGLLEGLVVRGSIDFVRLLLRYGAKPHFFNPDEYLGAVRNGERSRRMYELLRGSVAL